MKKTLAESIKLKADSRDIKAMRTYCYIYGIMLLNGNNGLKVNKTEAVKYFKMAADVGNTSAMCAYAGMLKNGDGVPTNKIDAAIYYKMAANKGDDRGMYNFALMLRTGDGILTDKDRAAFYYIKAIEKGNSNAMNDYASMMYYGDGIPENRNGAIYYYKIAAEKRHINAMNRYGLMLIYGEGVKKNKRMGFNYIKMAADKGNSDALFNLGLMYQCGWIESEDKERAAYYYEKAIERGNIDAMINYGLMLDNGEGIKRDKNKALEYYKMAINKWDLDILKLCSDINLISELIKYIEEKNIIYILCTYKNKRVKIENQKIIEIKGINDGRQGENQVKTNRKFIYDNLGNLTGVKDEAYNKKTGIKLYEISYKEDNNKEIKYFDINGRALITANINSDGVISFNLEGSNLKHLQREVNKIINSFGREESRGFDYYLSYLVYLLALIDEKQKKKEEKKEDITINVGCKSYDDLLRIINESSEQENRDKICICDFSTKKHNVQAIISNGVVILVNTGAKFNKVKQEINEEFQAKFPSKKINIAEFKFLNQETGNCVLASKICLVNLLKQVREYNKKAKKMAKAEIKLNELPKIIYDFDKFIVDYNKYETAKKTNSNANQNMIKNDVIEKSVLQNENISLMETILQTMMYTNKYNENAFLEIDKKFDNLTDKLYQQTPKGQAEREKNERRNTHNNNTRQRRFKSNREKRAEIKANAKKVKVIRDDFDGKSACCSCW